MSWWTVLPLVQGARPACWGEHSGLCQACTLASAGTLALGCHTLIEPASYSFQLLKLKLKLGVLAATSPLSTGGLQRLQR